MIKFKYYLFVKMDQTWAKSRMNMNMNRTHRVDYIDFISPISFYLTCQRLNACPVCITRLQMANSNISAGWKCEFQNYHDVRYWVQLASQYFVFLDPFVFWALECCREHQYKQVMSIQMLSCVMVHFKLYLQRWIHSIVSCGLIVELKSNFLQIIQVLYSLYIIST